MKRGKYMYKKDDYVLYQRKVCKVKEIKENYAKGESYYCLVPVIDPTLQIHIPITTDKIKNILTKDEALALIAKLPSIEPLKTTDKNIERDYKELLNTGNREDIVKIIKTAYLRNKKRIDEKKKIGSRDDEYFKTAEKYLYTELAVALGMTYDECQEFIVNKVGGNENA